MIGRPGRFGPSGRVVTPSGLQRWTKLSLVLVVGLVYLFLYKTIPVEVQVPVPYERWESAAGAAREKVRKTWNAKGVQDILNSTLGVCASGHMMNLVVDRHKFSLKKYSSLICLLGRIDEMPWPLEALSLGCNSATSTESVEVRSRNERCLEMLLIREFFPETKAHGERT